MWSTRKRSSETWLGHDKCDIPAFDTVLFHSNLSRLQREYLSNILTDKISSIELWAKVIKRPSETCYWGLENKGRKLDFRFVERIFLAAIIIAPEARNERSCQSFSASHIGPRADCPFHRPAFFRPVVISYATLQG